MRQRGRGEAAGLLAALLVAAPVLLGVAYSLAGALGVAGVGATGLTGRRLARALGDAATWQSLGWTLATALVATLLAAAAAVTLAVAFRGARAGDRLARALAVAPLPVPHVVAAAGAVLLLGQSGLLARLAHAAGLAAVPADVPALVLDPWGAGLVLTMAWKETPFLALVAFSLLAARGRELEDAARTLGAGPAATLRRVTLPVLARGLLPAAISAFTIVAGSYEAGALLGPSDPLPFPVLVLERYHDLDLARRGDAYVLTLLGLVVGLAGMILHEWSRARWERHAG